MSKTHRKKYRPIQIKTNAWSIAMAGRAALNMQDVEAQSGPIEESIRRIIAGKDDKLDWQRLFDVINVIAAFGRQGKKLLPVWREFHDGAEDLCVEVAERRKTGTLALHADEVRYFLAIGEVWRDLMTNCTKGQYQRALDDANKKVYSAMMKMDSSVKRVDAQHGVIRRGA